MRSLAATPGTTHQKATVVLASSYAEAKGLRVHRARPLCFEGVAIPRSGAVGFREERDLDANGRTQELLRVGLDRLGVRASIARNSGRSVLACFIPYDIVLEIVAVVFCSAAPRASGLLRMTFFDVDCEVPLSAASAICSNTCVDQHRRAEGVGSKAMATK